ncbi:MAG: hypothetical protein K2Z81_17950, partial [Cyanobacteria bacterium]|nr:hypothetical protein [Cyanobacteriota bacterium]
MKLLIFGFVSFFVLLGVVAASTWQTTRANLVTICCMKAALEQDLCQAAPGSAKKILFVGNALTATYMIPWAVAYFAEQKKHPRPKVCQLLVPEWTLERHYTEGKFQKLIKAEKWDVVVLQEAVGRALEEKAGLAP